MALPKSEIAAIAKLLRFPDKGTFKLLEEQLKTFDSILLRQVNNEIPLDDIDTRREFFNLVKKNKRLKLKNDFLLWAKKDSNDLEEGIFLIAQFDNPLLDLEYYVNILNNLLVNKERFFELETWQRTPREG